MEGTYNYDDGSTVSYTLNADGSGGVSSTAATDNGVAGWSQDQAEAQKFSQFYPGSKPWYEQLAMYGATRAIDSHFQRTETDKTAQPVTFAGQNGQTYAAGDTAPGPLKGMGGVLLLAGAAVLAFALLK